MLIEDLQVVLKVAEFRSITAAATNLDMHIATASAAVKRVEKALGLELFVRTTRHLRLSSAGERYIPQCEQALLTLELAKRNIKENLDIVDGELRIALPSDLGRNLVVDWMDLFMEEHPSVTLRTNISDSNIDFYRDSVDMALRYGKPTDANMYGFKICNVPRILCATTEYLASYGRPKHPNELAAHNGLFYQLYDVIHNVWAFSDGNTGYKVKINGNRATNDADLVRRWCVAGKGLAIKSCLDMSADLLTGNIENVMAEFKPTPTELWLVCPSKQSITPAMRLLRDNFREQTRLILQRLVDHGHLAPTVFD